MLQYLAVGWYKYRRICAAARLETNSVFVGLPQTLQFVGTDIRICKSPIGRRFLLENQQAARVRAALCIPPNTLVDVVCIRAQSMSLTLSISPFLFLSLLSLFVNTKVSLSGSNAVAREMQWITKKPMPRWFCNSQTYLSFSPFLSGYFSLQRGLISRSE